MANQPEVIMPGRDADVTLREVTANTVREIINLRVRPEQEKFVAGNAVSIAQAYFEPKAWFRAIYADEISVGFTMLSLDADKPEYYLWRFMIDSRYQHLGYGRQALRLIIEHVKTLPNASELLLSYVPAQGGPEQFYVGLGFVNTGKVEDGEMEMKLVF